MRRWGLRTACALALGLQFAGTAAAQEPASTWSRTTLPDAFGWAHGMASAGPAEALLLDRTSEGIGATAYGLDGTAGARQQLHAGRDFYPTIDASAAGGAVAAWYDEPGVKIHVAERPATGGAFTTTRSVPGGRSDFSYGRPLVKVNDRGDAIVVYLAEVLGQQEIRALVRRAGGDFGEPETIGTVAPWSTTFPRDVALGPDGTAVVGLVRDRVAHVAVRPAAGSFAAPQPLGGRVPEHSWQSPRVGVDAAGTVVAAWLEGAEPNTAGPVRMAFRRAGDTVFGAPQDTGVEASSLGRIGLGVSLVGETVLVVESETTNPYGGTQLQGLKAVMGNAGVRRLGEPAGLTDIWAHYPAFAMNSRGDAVVVYDQCCPMAVRAQRRAPLTGFLPPEDVQPPIAFEGVREGITVSTADVDELGNLRTTYTDGHLDQSYLNQAVPGITAEPPEVPALGDLIAPALAALPDEAPATGDQVTEGASTVPVTQQPPAVVPPPPPAVPRSVGARTVAPRDLTAPVVSLRVQRVVVGRRRPRLRTSVRCSEACSVALSGTFAGRRLRPVRGMLARAGRIELGLALPRRSTRRSARASRAQTARLVVTAVDRAGNASTRRSTTRVRRAR